MDEKSEPNQNKQNPDEATFGEPTLVSPPHSGLSHSEDREIFARERIRHFSQSVLSAEAWFHTANELIAAMDVLEPDVERFWKSVRGLVLDQKRDMSADHSAALSQHNLINQHMMLAGFAIENLCKGYLAGRLSHEERGHVKAGVLPESFKSHDILELIEQTGTTLSATEKYLVKRISEAAVWRGRYPSPTSHKGSRPFAQIGSDIRHIKTVLQKLRRHVGAKDS